MSRPAVGRCTAIADQVRICEGGAEMSALSLPESVDVAIVGAGTAGAAAAALCAARGLRTVCIDSAALDCAGATWVNGVPAWMFTRAGIDVPAGDELRGGPQRVRLIAGRGPRHIIVDDHGVLDVDMRLLVARLHDLARRRGATLVGDTLVHGSDAQGRLSTSRGAIAARVIVDASGLSGARLLQQPRVPVERLCAAAQEVRTLADPAGARAFFAAHGAAAGEALCFAGIAGGFSVLNVRCEADHVSLLSGSIPVLGYPPGQVLLDRFVAEQPWIGPRLFGGARAIPLRRPFDRLASADGRIALLGDAAGQVFPAHGSGIGAGLVAARLLADAIADDRGALDYALAWQREFGGLFASYELFRRFSATLTVEELGDMMDVGLMDPVLARYGLAQTAAHLPLAAVPGKLAALARAPRLAARLGAMVARMLATRALYTRYPADPAALPAWSRRVARVFGEPAETP
jgi:flavin-dependent dehydrogenase